MIRPCIFITIVVLLLFTGLEDLFAQDSNLVDCAERDLKLKLEMQTADTLLPCKYPHFEGFIENTSADASYFISFVRNGREETCFEPEFEGIHEYRGPDGKWIRGRESNVIDCHVLRDAFGMETVELGPGQQRTMRSGFFFIDNLIPNQKPGLNRFYFIFKFRPGFADCTGSLEDSISREKYKSLPQAVIVSDTFYVYYEKNPLEIKLIHRKDAVVGQQYDMSELFSAYIINTSDHTVPVRLTPWQDSDLCFIMSDGHQYYASYPITNSGIKASLGPGERIELIGESSRERGLSIPYKPRYPLVFTANLVFYNISDLACDVRSNPVTFEARDTVPKDLIYPEMKEISRKGVERSFELHANLKGDSLFECESHIELDIWLVNTSRDEILPAIEPDDGSYDGRRDGSVFYTIEVKDKKGRWKDFKKKRQKIYGCNFFDVTWLDDIVAVHPGDSMNCLRFYRSPNDFFDLSEPGLYRLYVHYKCGINDGYEDYQKRMKKSMPQHKFAYMPKFEIVSNPVEFEIHNRPIQLRLRQNGNLIVNEPTNLSDILDIDIINISDEPLQIYSPALDRYTQIWFKIGRDIRHTLNASWDSRDPTRNGFMINPGDSVSFFGTKELSRGFDYILEASEKGKLKIQAEYYYSLDKNIHACSRQIEIKVRGK